MFKSLFTVISPENHLFLCTRRKVNQVIQIQGREYHVAPRTLPEANLEMQIVAFR